MSSERPNPPRGRFAAVRRRIESLVESHEVFGGVMSLLLHLAIVMVLAMLFFPLPQQGGGLEIVTDTSLPGDLGEKPTDVPLPVESVSNDDGDESKQPADTAQVTENAVKTETTVAQEAGTVAGTANAPEAPLTVGEGAPPVRGVDGSRIGGFVAGGGLDGRNAGQRGRCLDVGDTTAQSEEAVERALNWLAAHQCKDGGWNFDLERNDSDSSGCGLCRNGGNHGSRVAATAAALLPFLGAGYSPDPVKKGKHWKTIDRGLAFLIRNGQKNRIDPGEKTLDFRQGYQGMYTQGLAVLALSEASAMNPRIKILSESAQEGVNFIIKAQDVSVSGGWRYRPREVPGDLSVTGWQLMALKSAHLADLYVPKPSLYRVGDFLDVLQYDGGRQYDYIPKRWSREGTGTGEGPDSSKTCTAIGLLSRLYLGWAPGEPKLDRGMEVLQEWGPLKNDDRQCNLYYAYYASLAMHHYGGSGWHRWFPKLRDHLVASQSYQGHENGSWHYPDHYCDTAGRVFNTALAAMILEVPYRYMPLYRSMEN